jgi:carboxypeptidase C (cathepsin A)
VLTTKRPATLLLSALLTVSLSAIGKDHDASKSEPAKEETKGPDKPADKPHKEDEVNLPPFPADKSAHQSMQLDGRTLKYEATVGSLPVLDEKGKVIASVMFTAYTDR